MDKILQYKSRASVKVCIKHQNGGKNLSDLNDFDHGIYVGDRPDGLSIDLKKQKKQ